MLTIAIIIAGGFIALSVSIALSSYIDSKKEIRLTEFNLIKYNSVYSIVESLDELYEELSYCEENDETERTLILSKINVREELLNNLKIK